MPKLSYVPYPFSFSLVCVYYGSTYILNDSSFVSSLKGVTETGDNVILSLYSVNVYLYLFFFKNVTGELVLQVSVRCVPWVVKVTVN